MKKSVELSKETVTIIESGKEVVGRIYIDKVSGKLVFSKFNRGKRKKDVLIAELESGWLKESKTRMKFFSSVKKSVGVKLIRKVMSRDLTTGMDAMESVFNS